jgi:hypothetical protein
MVALGLLVSIWIEEPAIIASDPGFSESIIFSLKQNAKDM